MPEDTHSTPAGADSPQRVFAVEVVRKLREAGHQALWAGGCVRDALLGHAPKDYDVATGATLTGVDNRVDAQQLTWQLNTVQAYVEQHVVLSADGSFDYTPNPNYNGADLFTYILDGTLAIPGDLVDATIEPIPATVP